MRRILLVGLIAALSLPAAPAFAAERTVRLAVENMTCPTCPYVVKQALTRVPGVVRAEVSYSDRAAVVTFDDARTDVAALTAATAGIGFPSQPAEQPAR